MSAALRCQLEAVKRAIATLSAAGRASFPAARERFERGLPPHNTFFVSTWLRDRAGREELVFVAVDSVVGRETPPRSRTDLEPSAARPRLQLSPAVHVPRRKPRGLDGRAIGRVGGGERGREVHGYVRATDHLRGFCERQADTSLPALPNDRTRR